MGDRPPNADTAAGRGALTAYGPPVIESCQCVCSLARAGSRWLPPRERHGNLEVVPGEPDADGHHAMSPQPFDLIDANPIMLNCDAAALHRESR